MELDKDKINVIAVKINDEQILGPKFILIRPDDEGNLTVIYKGWGEDTDKLTSQLAVEAVLHHIGELVGVWNSANLFPDQEGGEEEKKKKTCKSNNIDASYG